MKKILYSIMVFGLVIATIVALSSCKEVKPKYGGSNGEIVNKIPRAEFVCETPGGKVYRYFDIGHGWIYIYESRYSSMSGAITK